MELAFLTFSTFGCVLAFIYLNLRAMEKGKEEGAPKSTLSKDGAAEWLAKNAKQDA